MFLQKYKEFKFQENHKNVSGSKFERATSIREAYRK